MTATKSRAVGEMRRRFRAVVALAVLSLALAGCDSGSDRADGDEAVQMVDGLVCGVFDVDIVEAVVESDDYTASGTGVPEIGSAPDSGRIECSIGVGEDDFDHRVRFSASPIADKAEQTRVEAREAAALASSRQKIGEQGGHCFTSPTLDALGPGYVCRTDGRTQTRVVLPDRFVFLTLFGKDGTDDAVVATAVDLIENARGNLTARETPTPGWPPSSHMNWMYISEARDAPQSRDPCSAVDHRRLRLAQVARARTPFTAACDFATVRTVRDLLGRTTRDAR